MLAIILLQNFNSTNNETTLLLSQEKKKHNLFILNIMLKRSQLYVEAERCLAVMFACV